MKLLYPLIFLLLSCSTEPEVVLGCLDSTACNYNPSATTDNDLCAYEADCEGRCGGPAVLDNCDVCDTDSSNNCIQDCLGHWGGNAQLDVCSVCNGSGLEVIYKEDCNFENICDGFFEFNYCVGQLLFNETFTSSNMSLKGYGDSDEYIEVYNGWGVYGAHFEFIEIIDNELMIKGSNDSYAHRIWNQIDSLQLINEYELNASIAILDFDELLLPTIFGLMFYGEDITYHFLISAIENSEFFNCSLSTYNHSISEWNDFFWKPISHSDYLDIDSIFNIKFRYENSAFSGYVSGKEVFSYNLSDIIVPTSFGVYSQGMSEFRIDDIQLFGITEDNLQKEIINMIPSKSLHPVN